MLKSRLQNFLRYVDKGFVLTILVFLGLTLPLIFLDVRGASYFDHINYHLPSVLKIREHWPFLDIREDTLSAISPGYYWILATFSFLTGKSEISLRLLNLIISSLVPLSLYVYARNNAINVRAAFMIVLPLVVSTFFVKSSIWIMTDNPALLLVVLVLILTLDSNTENLKGIGIGIGFLSSIATFFRQTSFWLIVPSLLRAMLSSNNIRVFEVQENFTKPRSIIEVLKSNWVSFIAALFPCLVVAILYFSWGGLVPQRWVGASVSFSFCPIAYILSIFALIGSFYFWGLIRARKYEYFRSPSIIFAALIGLAISLISPTSFNHEAGRWGGYFWSIVQHLPTISDRSLFFIALSPIGSVIIAILWLEMRNAGMVRASSLWLASLVSWSATFLINRQIFHRYFEREVLVFLILAVCLLKQKTPNQYLKLDSWTIKLLIVSQLAITLAVSASS